MVIGKREIMSLVVITMAICFSFLSVAPVTLLAQSATTVYPSTPLLIGIRQGQSYPYQGDVWAWGGSEWIQRTANGYTYWPIVSPKGDVFAYQQASPEYVKQTGSQDSNDSNDDNSIRPDDIYLWNLTTALATPIALQPWNASLEDGKTRYTLRSKPAWSPDGNALAWTEIATDQTAGQNVKLEDEHIAVYDLTLHKTLTFTPQLPAHMFYGANPLMGEVSPGPDGLIALRAYGSVAKGKAPPLWFYIYDRTGHQLAQVSDPATTDEGYAYGDLIWLSGLDKPYLSCINCTTKIDPQTGEISPLNGSPELYSPLAPNNLSLYYGNDSGTESNTTWVIAFNGKQVGKFGSARIADLSDVAISPNGMYVATANYAGQGSTAGVIIFEAWNRRTLSDTVNLIGMGWGPMAWRVHPDSAN